MKTEVAKDIERAGESIQYDTQCKRVLANKVILAWIMRETIEEFSDMTVDEIIQCIDGTPQVEEVYVEPGRFANEKIESLNTEDKDENEGNITYDIRFIAHIPEKERKIKVLINVEAQKDYYQKYPIPSRGVYYGARMVSSQNGVEFKEPYYGDIKKVYSIWVCMNVPNYVGNAISVYEFQKRDIVAGLPDRRKDYDKISLIMICLNEEAERGKGFFDMMNTLLSPEIQVSKKKQILEEEYDIAMDNGLGKELEQMGPFTAYAIERVERGYERGEKAGMEAGMKAGMKAGKEEMIRSLIEEGTLTDEQIMNAAKMTKEEFQKIKEDMMCLS